MRKRDDDKYMIEQERKFMNIEHLMHERNKQCQFKEEAEKIIITKCIKITRVNQNKSLHV